MLLAQGLLASGDIVKLQNCKKILLGVLFFLARDLKRGLVVA